MSSADFLLKTYNFQKILLEIPPGVKQYVSGTGPMFCPAWSGSKLFAKVIRQNTHADKWLKYIMISAAHLLQT